MWASQVGQGWTESCPTLCNPTDCSPSGSSVHGILQARILEWVIIPFPRGSSWPRDWTWVSYIAGRFFIVWATSDIMQNSRLVDSQTRIKIAGRNINNLRYEDDTTLMVESKEELKSFLMRVKEDSEKAGLKLNIQKTKIMASSPITSWQIDGGKVETVTDFIYLISRITVDSDCNH